MEFAWSNLICVALDYGISIVKFNMLAFDNGVAIVKCKNIEVDNGNSMVKCKHIKFDCWNSIVKCNLTNELVVEFHSHQSWLHACMHVFP